MMEQLFMKKIQKLPDHIIAQIAAGEVIERPAYAIKELIENAIDAHANYIQIFIENAGLKKIMVIDNGEGMTREDLLECFKHHTTSKLSTDHNLLGIKSLGFRGEALSSISAVSTMTIKSRTNEAGDGTSITLEANEIKTIETVGIPKGTTVIVENIFGSVPARKKFLKTNRTEMRQIIEIIVKVALAYPKIHFTLNHNKKIVLDFPTATNNNERIKHLFGNDIFQQMIPVQFSGPYISFTGFISKPHIVATSTQKQYLFINNRPVQERMLSHTIREAYGTVLDSSSHPLFALFIHVPFEMVDVNVHPKKELVVLANEKNVSGAIGEVITNSIQGYSATQIMQPWKTMPGFATETLRDDMQSWNISFTRILKHEDIVQIHNLYLIVPTDTGMLFIDQHAAHERILYERLIYAFAEQKKKKEIYVLPVAVPISLSATQLSTLVTRKKMLTDLGFMFEAFGTDAIKITHIPLFFKDHDLKTFMYSLLDEEVSDNSNYIDEQSNNMLRFLACRTAVKAGDTLTKKQSKSLVQELEGTKNNSTCPHGRPTKTFLALRDIHKLFKRT